MLHRAHERERPAPRDAARAQEMSRGPSGRIVVEVDQVLKKRLHAALTLDGTTLKDWFLKQAEAYLTDHQGLAQEPAIEEKASRRRCRKGVK